MLDGVHKTTGIEQSSVTRTKRTIDITPTGKIEVTFDYIIGDDTYHTAGEHFAQLIANKYLTNEQLNAIASILEFANPDCKRLFNLLTDKAKRRVITDEEIMALGKMRIAGMLLADRNFDMPQPNQCTNPISINNITLDDLIAVNCLEKIADQFIRIARSGAITEDMISSNLDTRFKLLIQKSKIQELSSAEKVEYAKFILAGIVNTIYISQFGGFDIS